MKDKSEFHFCLRKLTRGIIQERERQIEEKGENG